jgi:hypothetical protein
MCRFLVLFLVCCVACTKHSDDRIIHQEINGSALFKKLTRAETGIDFTNTLTHQEDFDVFRYRNYYNGGGVGIADFNNDGLADVYLTSNMGDNKLYVNNGGWKFTDITQQAGVKGTKVWSTGVSIADVNADGWLDIYVCNAGDVKSGNRENELFINNGNLTFTESAKKYGLADKGFSTHAAFFDYDKDGDLDCYVLNNSYRPVSTLGYRNLRNERDEFGGHKLYRNDRGFFNDVSAQAGIYGSIIGFGLGVTVGDVNQDGWPDIYVSNDFYERDYLYINNKQGGFEEKLESLMGHISMFSMGADMADLNNDGYPEIFSTDMLPADNYRLKTLIAFETYDVYQLRLKNGYYHQYMRNMLHLNNKDGSFSEIGELAGVSATDWSWGALMVDFNNDLYKEILVCNGIYKDVIDQDFVEYLGSSEQMRAVIEGKKINFHEFVDRMPSKKLTNYLFTRKSDLVYQNVANEWGLGDPGFSNGAAYGDMDNDGDMDLIINNVNQELFVYKNQSRELTKNNYLTCTFKGKDKNVFGLGATLRAYVKDQILSFDHMPIRGFQSSMDYKIIMGLGEHEQVDSLVVTWPDQTVEIIKDLKANQQLTLDNATARLISVPVKSPQKKWLTAIHTDSIVHHENPYNDFDRDRLQYHMLSTQGPAFAKADLNHDGLDDFYMGGAVGNAGAIYLQRPGYKFTVLPGNFFFDDKESEDVGAVFFDADGDADLDLYVVTGGSETLLQSIHCVDRLYENKGTKNGYPVFERTTGQIPSLYQSGSCVRPADIDNDGDLDLFVGTRVIPSYYGLPCDQTVLINNGKGMFTDATASIAPQLKQLGMVTDATWFDYDADGYKDLLIVGEWIPITLFKNDGKKLSKVENIVGFEKTEGWWNSIKATDIDGDGDEDFILGNVGLNSKFKPTAESPIALYVNDFDRNGSVEPIFAFKQGNIEYPFALRQDIIKQMSSLKKQFVYFKDYANKSLTDIFDAKLLQNATALKFYEPHTSLLINNGASGFEVKHLPLETQFSPVYGIEVVDMDGDNHNDIVMGGNLFGVKPEAGRYDAMQGLILKNDGRENFTTISSSQSGLKIAGEVRHITVINSKKQISIAFIRNNSSVLFYRITK